MATSSKSNDGRDASMQVAAAVVTPQAEKPAVSPNLLVAAIDFGTAYSGYAYLSRENFDKDPLSISVPEWDRNKELKSSKTPTSILFNKDQEVVAFGNDAEKMFTELTEEEKHEEYYFFQKFKMLLYKSVDIQNDAEQKDKRLTKETELSDIKGKKMKAIDVFSAAIKYLKEHLLTELRNRGIDIKVEDIRWVLTVPAIWNDPAKQFMRDAAEQAEIQSDCLTIALEPEAASIFCKHLPMNQKKIFGSSEIQKFEAGSQYLVMDAGGGTVDITIHEIQDDQHIKEIVSASGGAWGGTYVDDQFHKMFEDILGENLFEEYKKECLADYMEIRQALEIVKRSFSNASSRFEIKLPPSLIKYSKKGSFRDLVKDSNYKEHIKCRNEKMCINVEMVKDLFLHVCDGIVKHVDKLLKENNINIVLMVGGFSESRFLQNKMEEAFPDKQIVIPNEAGLAVLKGAVLFGHKPKAITSRIAKYSYSVSTYMKFKHGEHPPDKLKEVDGKEFCSGVFSQHITKGEELKLDVAQKEQTYWPISENQEKVRFDVYTSTNTNPKYVDEDGCKKLATLNVDIPNTSLGTDRQVLVRFKFGNTEIKVEGENKETNEVTNIELKYEGTSDDEKQYASYAN